MCAISGISAGEFTVKQPFDPQLGSGMKEGRERQTQLLAKWVRAAGMITWIFKMRQLQTEASVTVTSMPSCVKQWQHVVQLQLSTELLLNISAFRERRVKCSKEEWKYRAVSIRSEWRDWPMLKSNNGNSVFSQKRPQKAYQGVRRDYFIIKCVSMTMWYSASIIKHETNHWMTNRSGGAKRRWKETNLIINSTQRSDDRHWQVQKESKIETKEWGGRGERAASPEDG